MSYSPCAIVDESANSDEAAWNAGRFESFSNFQDRWRSILNRIFIVKETINRCDRRIVVPFPQLFRVLLYPLCLLFHHFIPVYNDNRATQTLFVGQFVALSRYRHYKESKKVGCSIGDLFRKGVARRKGSGRPPTITFLGVRLPLQHLQRKDRNQSSRLRLQLQARSRTAIL
jgi:hypothetical protein